MPESGRTIQTLTDSGALAGAGDGPEDPRDRIVELVDDPFLERNDRVVGDVDVFGADLGAALGDVAVADSV